MVKHHSPWCGRCILINTPCILLPDCRALSDQWTPVILTKHDRTGIEPDLRVVFGEWFLPDDGSYWFHWNVDWRFGIVAVCECWRVGLGFDSNVNLPTMWGSDIGMFRSCIWSLPFDVRDIQSSEDPLGLPDHVENWVSWEAFSFEFANLNSTPRKSILPQLKYQTPR